VPGAPVHAVYGGHKFAREFGESIDPDRPYRRELPALGQGAGAGIRGRIKKSGP
jgi:hypothetical protein